MPPPTILLVLSLEIIIGISINISPAISTVLYMEDIYISFFYSIIKCKKKDTNVPQLLSWFLLKNIKKVCTSPVFVLVCNFSLWKSSEWNKFLLVSFLIFLFVWELSARRACYFIRYLIYLKGDRSQHSQNPKIYLDKDWDL